jgi:hypothetical protein
MPSIRYILPASILLALLIAGGLFSWFGRGQPNGLLPAGLTKHITSFTPYFFKSNIPAGYAVDTGHTQYSEGTLFITLTKAGQPSLVLTEQPMPSNLTDQDIQQNSSSIKNTSDPATINDIEGRLVGTMVARARNTLILLNAPGNASKDDLTVLLQGLEPLH